MKEYRECSLSVNGPNDNGTSDYLVDDSTSKRQKLCQKVEESQLASDMARQPCENTYSFNQLPLDILAEIFVRCLPEVRLWPVIRGRSTKDVAPLLLCNVCSMWRAAALSTPRLWQTLFLDFGQTMPEPKEAVAMTHTWIGRSGMLPLTLSLFAGDEDLVKAMVNALINYTSRWEHVRFTYIFIPLSRLEPMPCLRTLSCWTRHCTQTPFAKCPKLARIRWHGKSAVPLAPLPWHQLTHIHLEDLASTRDIIFVIRSCSKLTELEVRLKNDEAHESLSCEITMNKSLRKLEIEVSPTCRSLLGRLALPALTDIVIKFDCDADTHGFQKVLLDFFSRSKCKLFRIDLSNCGFNDGELLECLKHDSCTALMNLRLASWCNFPMFTDSVLLALTDMRPVENNLLLPKLACLSLESCLNGSPGRLGTMALSRCTSRDKALQRLQRLKIYCTDLDKEDIDLLRLAEIQGLEFLLDPDDDDDDE